jgi:hypothetical protein
VLLAGTVLIRKRHVHFPIRCAIREWPHILG